ncbi:hypothetical protein AVEN_176659-1, partial [Araneus ventricosus]
GHVWIVLPLAIYCHSKHKNLHIEISGWLKYTFRYPFISPIDAKSPLYAKSPMDTKSPMDAKSPMLKSKMAAKVNNALK